MEIINGNPLEILPNLSNYDAIFIDDDANWYTIFMELNIIKNSCEDFPLIINNITQKIKNSTEDLKIFLRKKISNEPIKARCNNILIKNQ